MIFDPLFQNHSSSSSSSHRPLQRSSNPFVNTSQPPIRNSSDDLLKDYGLDFGQAFPNPPKQLPTMSDFFLDDLDPLKNNQAPVTFPTSSVVNLPPPPPPTLPPVAPPRTKKASQNWTTFE